jgi:PHP family Zn ribbon phosphoesterase
VKTFRADLHVHSCLSPCADIDVSPKTLARRAKKLGLDMLALTDHNSCLNGPAHRDCCKEFGIIPIFGMELTTTEEVDMLCLFETLEAAQDFEALVQATFPRYPVDEKFWNPEYVVNSQEEILGELDYLLTTASGIDLTTGLKEVHSRGGIGIPAHIDRNHNSLLSQLGFIPSDPFDGIEITLKLEESQAKIPHGKLPRVANSDCHIIYDLGQRHTEFYASECSFKAYVQALRTGQVAPKWGFPE